MRQAAAIKYIYSHNHDGGHDDDDDDEDDDDYDDVDGVDDE